MKKIFISLLLVCSVFTVLAQDSTSAKVDELIAAYQKLGKFNGSALVASHGRVLLQKGYGYSNEDKKTANGPETIYQIASVTKTFTSTMVLKLVEMHKLSLTDKLSSWYPGFPNAGKISIENLLSHTAGIYDYTHEDTVTHLNTETKMMAFLVKKKLDFEPGSDWRYSNSGYSILGFIISKASGLTYEQAIRKYIFAPLKMNHSGFDFERLSAAEKATGYTNSDNGKIAASFSDSAVVFAAGAIYSTVGDLYKWHAGLQNYKIVSSTLMNKAYTRFKKNYGYGWIIDSVENKKMVYHSGNIAGFSSVLVRIPADDICIALLNNQEGTELEGIARKILDILYHRPYTIPAKKTAVILPDSILNRYTGTYDIADIHLTAEVTLENHQLIVHAVNGPTFPLTAERENHFYINDGQAEVEFINGANGKIIEMAINQNNQRHTGKKIK